MGHKQARSDARRQGKGLKIKYAALRLSLDPEVTKGLVERAGKHVIHQGALMSGPNVTFRFTFPTQTVSSGLQNTGE